MKEANRNLIIRVLTAVTLAPILILVVLAEADWPFALCIHAGVVISLLEFYWITLRDDPVWMRIAGAALGLGCSLTMYWCPRPEALAGALMLSTLAVAVLHLVRFGELATAAARTGLMVFGLIYVALFLTPLALLKRTPDGAQWMFLVLTVTWLSDTGAYFTGRAFGRRKLYRAISPGKSVEGALGGLAASVLSGVVAKLWYLPALGWVDVIVIGLVGGALGQAGDLVESMIKRGHEVKDSGWILPGHGGLLDRIDALLFTAPFIYLYATHVFYAYGPLG